MPPPRRVKLELGLLLRQSHQRAAAALNNALSSFGLTGRHFGVMMIVQREGTSTQRDLIRQTGSDKAGMTRTVADLENLGYLSRTSSASDKRVADLMLTTSGIEVFEAAKRRAAEAAEELFGSFTPDELETLEDLLRRFVGRPDASSATSPPVRKPSIE